MKSQAVILMLLQLVYADSEATVCTTPGCLEIARIFNQSMDLSINPCDDFYHFSCGNFIQSTTIPEAEAQFGMSEIIDKTIRQELKKELEAKSLTGQPPSFVKAKEFYHSCMDTFMIERYSLLNMKARLNQYGGWPVLQERWNDSNFDWIATMKRLTIAGQYNDQIVSVFVDVSDKDTSKRIVAVDAGYHTLSRRTLLAGLEDVVTRTYLGVLVDIAVAFGANKARAEQDMREVLQFEIALVNLSYSSTKAPKVPRNISELQEVWPYIPWLDLIRTYIGYNLNITASEPVAVYAPTYLTNLADLLRNTPKRLLANYIMAQLIFASREDFNQEILNISQRLIQVRFGKTSLPPRWEFCLGKLFNNMDVSLAATYIRKYFSPADKQRVKQITDIFQDQLVNIIAKEEWMSSNTKNRAMNKVLNIRDNVGYPDELLNDTILNQYFQDLHICPWDLYCNVLSIWKWSTYRSHQKLRKLVNPYSWESQTILDVVIANARYSTSRNSIDIFAAVLQYVYFSSDRPPFLNFGTLSSVIGHELTHSVDNNGRRYNEKGDYEDWWDSTSEEAFKKRAKSLVDEYSTYVVKEVNMTLNGEAIQGEVIADQGGYKIARTALEDWLRTQPDQDPRLVGFEQYSAAQVFWLGAASTWCTKERLEFLRTEVLDSDHPPSQYRVNGPFRMSLQFAQDWGCPVGSYMNPKDKFNVW